LFAHKPGKSAPIPNKQVREPQCWERAFRNFLLKMSLQVELSRSSVNGTVEGSNKNTFFLCLSADGQFSYFIHEFKELIVVDLYFGKQM
jgi:hypothetical protein